jgi:hypothetical protein
MKRAEVTYGQLDKVLRSFGFSSRLHTADPPPARVYEHKHTGALITLPPLPEEDKVFEYHLAGIRGTLDNFGIAEPSVFAAKLQKAG